MPNKMKSVSFSLGGKPTELHGISKRSNNIELKGSIAGGTGRTIDANLWLAKAAEVYNISKSLSDYILVPVPSAISDISNTNGDSVSKAELLKFNPDYGCLAYQTWKGKGTYLEHQEHTDRQKAKGVILDVYLRPLKQFKGDHAKVIKLLAYDRSKDPALAKAILEKRVNTYSLGMYYKAFSCSVCGNRVSLNSGRDCEHTKMGRPVYKNENNQLAFRRCEDIVGFETSCVSDPAYISAISDHVIDVSSFR